MAFPSAAVRHEGSQPGSGERSRSLRKAGRGRGCRSQSWLAALQVFLVILLFSNDRDNLLFGKSPRGVKANV